MEEKQGVRLRSNPRFVESSRWMMVLITELGNLGRESGCVTRYSNCELDLGHSSLLFH